MGQLYASREILFNCKIFSLQRQWSSLWEEGVSGGELSYQVECQDNKMELERNYSWNIFLLPYYYNSVSSSSPYSSLYFCLSRVVRWSVTFCLVFCDIGSGVSVTLMIPTFLEEWNSKQLQMEKCETENLNPISWLVSEINRNSLKVEIFHLNIKSLFDRHQPYICPSSIGW